MEGGLQGAPSKISIFLEGIYFGGPWTNPKSKKFGKIFFEPLLLHKKEHFFVLGWWNIFLRVILDLANITVSINQLLAAACMRCSWAPPPSAPLPHTRAAPLPIVVSWLDAAQRWQRDFAICKSAWRRPRLGPSPSLLKAPNMTRTIWKMAV